MPVIASQTIHVDVKTDKSIVIKILDEFKKSKCIHLPSLGLDKSEMDKVKDVVMQLVGEKAIECDKDTCCISTDYFNFVEKLGGLK